MTKGTLLTIAAITSALALGTGEADAQHGGHHGPGAAEACDREFERTIADGRGFGMAFAADRHGYPGPLHVLELADGLGLTPEQTTAVRALRDAMFAESRPKGAALLAAERRLEALFASGQVDEAALGPAVADIERLRGELRVLHLATHVKTAALLTAEQRRVYRAARWAGP